LFVRWTNSVHWIRLTLRKSPASPSMFNSAFEQIQRARGRSEARTPHVWLADIRNGPNGQSPWVLILFCGDTGKFYHRQSCYFRFVIGWLKQAPLSCAFGNASPPHCRFFWENIACDRQDSEVIGFDIKKINKKRKWPSRSRHHFTIYSHIPHSLNILGNPSRIPKLFN
jgi:hypothetical protein